MKNEILRKAKGVKNTMMHRLYVSPKLEKDIVASFTKLYHNAAKTGKTVHNTYWLGTRTQKYPTDMWVYQELIFKIKPDVIIECGTAYGGSALYFASVCDSMNKGKVITIDTVDRGVPQHDRIKYLLGESTSETIVNQVKELIKDKKTILVILDSDHYKENVLKELQIYSEFVTKDSYIIAEDTLLNGHPVEPDYGAGPMEAVEEFMENNKDFEIDKTQEKFYLTASPNGFLKRIK